MGKQRAIDRRSVQEIMKKPHDKKLRILHFAGSYLPVAGGTTTRITNMLAFPENEHTLVVPYPSPMQLGGKHDIAVSEEERMGHIHVYRGRLRKSTTLLRRLPYCGSRMAARDYVDCVAGDRYDIIHGHNPAVCALASLRAKRLCRIPMVYEAHGIMRDFPHFVQDFGRLTPLNQLACKCMQADWAHSERKVLDAADRVIVQTDVARDRLQSLYKLADKPIDVIRNGVDCEAFDPAHMQPERDRLRQQHGWNDHIVCLYAGYLDKINGIDFLLRALKLLEGDIRRRLRFVLLGRGPLQQEVAEAARELGDVLDYPGVVGHEEMPAYYAACDVFMIPRPSYLPAETLIPMKLLEAMAMEKVVLVSDVAAMAEIITDGQNGLVFEKGNTEDFLRKLDIIVKTNSQLQEFGKQARADVLAEYTWQSSRKQLQRIYEQLVS